MKCSAHHLSGIHPHPDGGLDLPALPGPGGNRLDGPLHAQSTEDRSLGVIFMGHGSTKQCQHGIPGILLHRAAVPLDLRAHGLEVCCLDVSDFFGIE